MPHYINMMSGKSVQKGPKKEIRTWQQDMYHQIRSKLNVDRGTEKNNSVIFASARHRHPPAAACAAGAGADCFHRSCTPLRSCTMASCTTRKAQRMAQQHASGYHHPEIHVVVFKPRHVCLTSFCHCCFSTLGNQQCISEIDKSSFFTKRLKLHRCKGCPPAAAGAAGAGAAAAAGGRGAASTPPAPAGCCGRWTGCGAASARPPAAALRPPAASAACASGWGTHPAGHVWLSEINWTMCMRPS